jgi:PilZ domain-containing protein
MTEKRKYTRYSCKIKINFKYYTGNPDEINTDITIPEKGKGLILDLSEGGLFFLSNELVTIESPVELNFSIKKNKYNVTGKVIRTGFINNNPSEIAKKFSMFSSKGKYYIAIEFDTPITNLILEDLR